MAQTPILGCVFMFAGNFAPKGYAFCAGQLMSIAQNSALFSILGVTYGGDGKVTFALPDLRGRFPVQQGQGAGLQFIDLGESSGVTSTGVLTNQMPSHNHIMACDSSGAANTDPAGGYFGNEGFQVTPTYFSPGPGSTVMSPLAVGLTGGSQPVSIQNPCLGINYIIATAGIYPSRN
jgi:microcystin-dependent protein